MAGLKSPRRAAFHLSDHAVEPAEPPFQPLLLREIQNLTYELFETPHAVENLAGSCCTGLAGEIPFEHRRVQRDSAEGITKAVKEWRAVKGLPGFKQ